jgi:hypothetical protein
VSSKAVPTRRQALHQQNVGLGEQFQRRLQGGVLHVGHGANKRVGEAAPQENDAERAARAALSIQRALAEVNRKNAGSGKPSLNAREKERAMISARTKAALAAAKARGVALGGPKLAEARERAVASNKASADACAANVLPVIREIRRPGATSLHQIADALNARGITTPRGGKWYAKSVSNVLARA